MCLKVSNSFKYEKHFAMTKIHTYRYTYRLKIIENVIYSCDITAAFLRAITPVFRVT